MQYTGMEAMQMPGLRYNPVIFVFSLIVAHVLAMAALSIRIHLRATQKMPENAINYLAGTVIGISVAGMHYTAMAASVFHEVAGAHIEGSAFSHASLAAGIGLFATIILGLSILATWIDRQIGFQRLLHLERMAHTDALTDLPNRVLFDNQL